MRLAQDAVLQSPRDANVLSTLAEAYYAANQPERAYRAARAALQVGVAMRDANLADIESIYRKCRSAAGVTESEAPAP